MLQTISSESMLTGPKEKKTAMAKNSLMFVQTNSELLMENEPFEEAMEQALQQEKREFKTAMLDRKADERSASEIEEMTQLPALEASIDPLWQSFTRVSAELDHSLIPKVGNLLPKEGLQSDQLNTEQVHEELSALEELLVRQDFLNPAEQETEPMKLGERVDLSTNEVKNKPIIADMVNGQDPSLHEKEIVSKAGVETVEQEGDQPLVPVQASESAEKMATSILATSLIGEGDIRLVPTEKQATAVHTGDRPVQQRQQLVPNRSNQSNTEVNDSLLSDKQVELPDEEPAFTYTEKKNAVPSTDQTHQQVDMSDVKQEVETEAPIALMKSVEPETKRIDKSDVLQPLPLTTASTVEPPAIVKQSNMSDLLTKQLYRILQAAVMNRSANGQQQLTLKLHPESLGRMHIQFIQQKQGLLIKIVADKKGTVEMVERALPGIRQLLPNLDQKIEVEQFEEENSEDNQREKQGEQKEQDPQERKKTTFFEDWLTAKSEVEEEFDDAN